MSLLSGRMSDAQLAELRAGRNARRPDVPPSRNRMSPDQLAATKAPSQAANEAVALARQALSGDDKAGRKLRSKYGDKEAEKLIEQELVRNGAKPKAKANLLRKIFG